ncbi:hypothetical protein SDC9_150783 [bioreactor metagenome]|uniref:Uncharacterized protein n=1 Tax=bioreactor metagenome TaxID=1076179 RepID=A0A645ESQ9_9ZZZZ
MGLQWLDALVGEFNVLVAQVAGTHHLDVFALDPAFGALAGDAVETLDRELFLRGGGDGLGDGVGGMRVHRGRVSAQRFLVDIIGHYERFGDTKAAFGQRAGFVENDGLKFPGPLERHPIANEQAVFRGQRRGDSHHQRHGEAERMGAGDDHDGDGAFDGEREPLAHENLPDHEGDYTTPQRHDGEPERRSVGEVLGLRFAFLGLLHQVNDLREKRILAGALDLDGQ